MTAPFLVAMAGSDRDPFGGTPFSREVAFHCPEGRMTLRPGHEQKYPLERARAFAISVTITQEAH